MTDSSPPTGRLLYAASESCADMLYATGVLVPDPFLWMQTPTQTLIIVNALEVGRVRRQAQPHQVVLSTAEASERFGLTRSAKAKTAELVQAIGEHFGITAWEVPNSFPLGLARDLEGRAQSVTPLADFFPQRRRKCPTEIENIREGVALCEDGFARAEAILREAAIGPDSILHWHNQPLTAEILRGEIDARIALLGGTASHTITAPGIQGADPHQAGHGPIRTDEPIVIDIFPRVDRTGYHGDFTRTLLKGTAPDIVKAAFEAVKAAQQAAIAAVRAGIKARDVHRAAADSLEKSGFQTSAEAAQPFGFFHGTGHGLGLEVHEAPRVGTNEDLLEAGNVITIEPGLYYPEWGGIRLEDVVVVEKDGCRNLTTAPCVLEVP